MVFLGRILRSARATPGRQWIGKHRKAKKVSGHSIGNAQKWKTLQARNELVLARPFLSQCEENGSAVEKKAKLREEQRTSRLLARATTKSTSSEMIERLKRTL
ncbi:large ribosomal subunit protein mL63-like [Corticium candelabrum]|uniref:large ribosomal subunit protein mL63-like n=1 Tax=Corticium candelabrum TaxID=121492 RepID=UPI002E258404|nr:large ribosomal subunit protein mL63-like [Corticium candelabrum]